MCSSESGAANVVSVVLLNRRSEVERLWQLVEGFGAAQQFSADDTATVNLVLDEVVINVIEHGYDDEHEHSIHVRLALDGGTLTIQVEDDARAFNPLDAPAPNLDLPIEERPIGGLGVFIVRSMMDAIEYRRDGGRNILTMRKTMGA